MQSPWSNSEIPSVICHQLFHRYYGESHPTKNLSTDNLKYLSSRQALRDIVAFREFIVKQFNLSKENKWISFGGSYPGMPICVCVGGHN